MIEEFPFVSFGLHRGHYPGYFQPTFEEGGRERLKKATSPAHLRVSGPKQPHTGINITRHPRLFMIV